MALRFLEHVENVLGHPTHTLASFLNPRCQGQLPKTSKPPFLEDMGGECRRNSHKNIKVVKRTIILDKNVITGVNFVVEVALGEAWGFGGGLGEMAFVPLFPDPKSGAGNFPKWPGARGNHPKSWIAKWSLATI